MVNEIQIGTIVGIAIVVSIGFYVSKNVKGDVMKYLLAGRKLPFFIVAAALMGQGIGANVTLGNVELVFKYGFWSGFALPLGLGITLFLTGLLFAEKLNSMKLITLPDFFRRTYNRNVEVICSLFMVLGFGVLLAGNLSAVGMLVESLYGIDYFWNLIIISAIIFSYTFLGGFLSESTMDVFYMILVLMGGVGAVAFFILTYGGDILLFDPAITDSLGYSLTQFTIVEHGALINWATIFALGLGDIVALDFMVRVFSAKDPKTARKGCLIASLGYVVVGLMFALLGIIAMNVFAIESFDHGENPAIFDLLFNFTPAILSIFILTAIVGSSMAFSDGALITTSAVITHNLLEKKAEKKDKGRGLLNTTRITLIPVILIGIAFAFVLPAPGSLLALAFDVVFAGVFVPFLFGFYWKKPSPKAALYAVVAGSATRLLFFILTPKIYGNPNNILYIPNDIMSSAWDGVGTLVAPVVCLAVFLIVHYTDRQE